MHWIFCVLDTGMYFLIWTLNFGINLLATLSVNYFSTLKLKLDEKFRNIKISSQKIRKNPKIIPQIKFQHLPSTPTNKTFTFSKTTDHSSSPIFIRPLSRDFPDQKHFSRFFKHSAFNWRCRLARRCYSNRDATPCSFLGYSRKLCWLRWAHWFDS